VNVAELDQGLEPDEDVQHAGGVPETEPEVRRRRSSAAGLESSIRLPPELGLDRTSGSRRRRAEDDFAVGIK
jgi:hypothetical protein